MRIRPAFWFVLLLCCSSILIFAALHPSDPPLRVRVGQQYSASEGLTVIDLKITDTQGLPVSSAQITPRASMTNMPMFADQHTVEHKNSGQYRLYLKLSMAGPWAITIDAQAQGFQPAQKTLLIDVI